MTQDGTMTESKRIIVRIDKDLEDLIPGYIGNRHKDIKSIRASLESGDFENIRILGHSMKGSGGGYGFDEITTIGASIEKAAKENDVEEIKKWIEKLSQYIESVDIIYG
ncbi:MAG: Hpt domain-containing protein [Proteobacteria bacterium]|nr:Hpt domain-containing protein [Pseudomonadota bacterium]